MNEPLETPSTDQSLNVYAWEESRFEHRDQGSFTLSQCRNILASIWEDFDLMPALQQVTDGRGSLDARVTEDKIHLPRWSRNPVILMHEMAHCITDLIDVDSSYDHSGTYMHVYLTLLSAYCSYKYDELFQSAKDFGLKVEPLDLGDSLKIHMKCHQK